MDSGNARTAQHALKVPVSSKSESVKVETAWKKIKKAVVFLTDTPMTLIFNM